MADVTVTAANVLPSSAAKKITGTAGATITAGDVLYLDTAANTYKLADASAVGTAKVAGIAACDAATGQPVVIVTKDPDLDVGGTLAIGTIYVVSATAGGIAPEADILSTEFVTILGIANAADSLNFDTGEHLRATAAHA